MANHDSITKMARLFDSNEYDKESTAVFNTSIQTIMDHQRILIEEMDAREASRNHITSCSKEIDHEHP